MYKFPNVSALLLSMVVVIMTHVYPECVECWEDGIRPGEKRNYNVCNTDWHESWKVNRMICKNTIEIDKNTELINGGSDIDE